MGKSSPYARLSNFIRGELRPAGLPRSARSARLRSAGVVPLFVHPQIIVRDIICQRRIMAWPLWQKSSPAKSVPPALLQRERACSNVSGVDRVDDLLHDSCGRIRPPPLSCRWMEYDVFYESTIIIVSFIVKLCSSIVMANVQLIVCNKFFYV